MTETQRKAIEGAQVALAKAGRWAEVNALRTALAEPVGEPVHGDILPPLGSRVFIRHGRDDDAHACTVTGYYAWGDLKGDRHLSRVFVRLVYEGTSIAQARMLCDCWPTAEAALLQAAPQTQQPVEVPLKQIAEALRQHGLTLIKKANGYDVMKLGNIEAQEQAAVRQKAGLK